MDVSALFVSQHLCTNVHVFIARLVCKLFRDGFGVFGCIVPGRCTSRRSPSPIEFSGIGLHTGASGYRANPSGAAGKGIIFRRVDLDNFELRADVASVARVAYATTLMSRGVWISTVEHLLSALYGVGVDNAYIELDNFEVPILDGSAMPYTEAIARVGIASRTGPGNTSALRRNSF